MMHNMLKKICIALLLIVFSFGFFNVYAQEQTQQVNGDNNANADSNNTEGDNNQQQQPPAPPKVYKCMLSDDKLNKMFSPTVEYSVSDKTFVLKINHDVYNTKDERVIFRVVSIGHKRDVDGVGKTVSYRNDLRLDRKTIERAAFDGVVNIEIQSLNYGNCKEVSYCNGTTGTSKVLEGQCSSNIIISFDHDIGGEQLTYPAKNLKPITSSTVGFVNKVSCDASKLKNYRDETNSLSGSSSYNLFVKRYCMAKLMAEGQGNVYTEGNNTLSQVRASKALKCNEWTVNGDEVAAVNGVPVLTEKEISEGYRNATYYEASFDRTLVMDQYKYRHKLDPYSPYTYEPALSCVINCTEVVKTAYMPPVASKAGFCFDYKIKVESMVSCQVKTPPSPPDQRGYSYCYPSPACHHIREDGSDDVYTSAGPTEDFDECIQDCDGGKYSQKCSKKCYNKVYGKYIKSKSSKLSVKNSANALKLSNTQAQNQIQALNDCVNRSSNGCYYRSGGGVYFKPKSKGKVNGIQQWMAGTYYIKRGAGTNHAKWNYKDYVVSRDDGFFRKIFDSGSICGAVCEWIEGDCEGMYLNEESGYAEADWEANVETYEAAKAECNAGATCSKRVTEYVLEVDYTNDGGKHTVRFPQGTIDESISDDTENKDVIKSENSGACPTSVTGACAKKNPLVATEDGKFNTEGISCTDKTLFKDYGGCYVCSTARNYYMGEIQFPGTWIDNKTGTISYSNKGDGWRKEDKKFCIPLDAKDANPLWWLWYMKKTQKKESLTEIKEYSDICLRGENITDLKTGAINETRKYNIRASVKDFGYYGWNFNFSCFYGLKEGAPPVIDETSKEIEEKCGTKFNYKMRAIDPDDIFPAQDGTILNKGEGAINTGRIPGFNWTSYATISAAKDPYMATNPTELIGAIQKRGQDIYDESKYKSSDDNPYLDYEFYLTPNTLNFIKSESKNYAEDLHIAVTDSEGEPNGIEYGFSKAGFELCGHRVYRSSLIDALNNYNAVKKRINPNGTAKCCNNYDGHGGCEIFGKDE